MTITVTSDPTGIPIVTTPTQPVLVTVPIGKKGDKGDKGDPGQDAKWQRMTQAQFDDTPSDQKDDETLYVIIG